MQITDFYNIHYGIYIEYYKAFTEKYELIAGQFEIDPSRKTGRQFSSLTSSKLKLVLN